VDEISPCDHDGRRSVPGVQTTSPRAAVGREHGEASTLASCAGWPLRRRATLVARRGPRWPGAAKTGEERGTGRRACEICAQGLPSAMEECAGQESSDRWRGSFASGLSGLTNTLVAGRGVRRFFEAEEGSQGVEWGWRLQFLGVHRENEIGSSGEVVS
jgi:hypothetical protein